VAAKIENLMRRQYTVVLQKGEDGWWIANVPILHATAQGRTRSTALKRAKSLIQFALDTMRNEGTKLPVEDPSSLTVVKVQAAI
jgi:predicted RNase H-like HicB family nuclease